MTTTRTPLLFLLSILPLAACTDAELGDPALDPPAELDEPDGSDELAATSCTVSGTSIPRSLAVTDPTVLAKFSFNRVMSRIRTTSNSASTSNRALFQAWFKTFGATSATGDCNDATIDPEGYGLQCPRPAEAKLGAIDPFSATSGVTFQPVGLFNRLDLAPSNGAHCGEHRIVYAMESTNPNIVGRGFLIFEAALPNPRRDLGKAGCLPVARFWQGLTADPDAASRAAKLEKFYLTGGAIAGFPTVVHANHYGLATNTGAATAGQIRTNMFVDFVDWQLREFKLRRSCTDPSVPSTCTLRFQHVTVKANPANELFVGTHARSSAFRTNFLAQIPALSRNNVSTMGMNPTDVFNEFESVAIGSDVFYGDLANTTLRNQIKTRLTELGSTLTVDHILDRAQTQTCAGCHLSSGGQPLGGGQTWPQSLGFVHVDENRNLSEALRMKFLPHRKGVLERFINESCAPAARVAPAGDDDGLTIGGGLAGAAN